MVVVVAWVGLAISILIRMGSQDIVGRVEIEVVVVTLAGNDVVASVQGWEVVRLVGWEAGAEAVATAPVAGVGRAAWVVVNKPDRDFSPPQIRSRAAKVDSVRSINSGVTVWE